MSLATPIASPRLCRLAGVSRAGFYRWRCEPKHFHPDLELRNQIQRIALACPCYGWRRITAELRRRGWKVNFKRVRRIMRRGLPQPISGSGGCLRPHPQLPANR